MSFYPTFSLANLTRRSMASGCLLSLLFFAASFSASAAQNKPSASGATRSGAAIYRSYCSVCHGDRGDGKSRAKDSFAVPPRNYTTPESAIELTRERMILSVTHGRPGTAMIAWGSALSEQEIAAVVDHIRTTFMKLNKQEAVRPHPSEKLLASRGGVLYMQTCVMCHGETGVRQISGTMQPPPRDFASPSVIAELTRKRMITSITNGRPGTAMRPYGGQYSASDIEAMVDFIREAFMSGTQQKK